MNELANNMSNTGMSTRTSLLVNCVKGQFLPRATSFPGPNLYFTILMVFSATYTICEGLKLDAYMSQSVTSVDCRHDTICQHK